MKTIFLKVTLCVSVFAIATISWLKIQSTDVFSDIQLPISKHLPIIQKVGLKRALEQLHGQVVMIKMVIGLE